MVSKIRNCAFLMGVILLVSAPALAVSSGDLPAADQARLDAAASDQAKLEILQELATARPDDAAVQFQLGNTFYDLGQLDTAIATYRKALQIDPGYVPALKSLPTGTISARSEPPASRRTSSTRTRVRQNIRAPVMKGTS